MNTLNATDRLTLKSLAEKEFIRCPILPAAMNIDRTFKESGLPAFKKVDACCYFRRALANLYYRIECVIYWDIDFCVKRSYCPLTDVSLFKLFRMHNHEVTKKWTYTLVETFSCFREAHTAWQIQCKSKGRTIAPESDWRKLMGLT